MKNFYLEALQVMEDQRALIDNQNAIIIGQAKNFEKALLKIAELENLIQSTLQGGE